ncbi:MAG TPA: adenylate/guanylate cyclase domain-containing protein [Solirubrobacteraceae bacterium]
MSDDDRPLPAPVSPPAPPRGRMRDNLARIDRAPALVRAVEQLRKRLPGDERFGDPLSRSDRTAVALLAREAAAMDPGRPSVAHELGLTALQLWQLMAEGAGRGAKAEREVAILFTDLVGFSSWALKAGDGAAIELLRETAVVLEEAIAMHDGRVIKRLGDGLMAVFDHPADAVGAALDALEGLGGVEVRGYNPKMRAGVHWGKPKRVGNDYLGVDVNIAARVADEAKGEQLLVSDTAFGLLELDELRYTRPRRLRAKGAPSEMRVRRIERTA